MVRRATFLAAAIVVVCLAVEVSYAQSRPYVVPSEGLVPAPRPALRLRNPWALMRSPAEGNPDAIGTYTAGCLRGASRLPLRGIGYRVIRPLRNFGHPNLVSFIEHLGRSVQAGGMKALAVADLGQPRGGPSSRGHASHQIGLDADIWYLPPRLAHRAMAAGGRGAGSVVDRRHGTLDPRWHRRVQRMLELTAMDPRVSKILVNPAVKRALCASVTGDRAWLGKLQPWWGHFRHFHVQLACPSDSPLCRAVPVPRVGNGCDEVAWWFVPDHKLERHARRREYQAKVGIRSGLPQLPAECAELLPDAFARVLPATTSRRPGRRPGRPLQRRDAASPIRDIPDVPMR